jgi:TRAP-type C4-dicarboxylate transport system permease small subunit
MRLIKWLDEHFEEYIMVVLLALIACIMMLQIIMRYIVNSSLSWSEEFSRYCFVWTTFLSIGYSIKKGIILRMDIVVHFLPKIWQKAIEVVLQVIVLAFFGYLFLNSFKVVKNIYLSGQTSPAMGVPMFFIYSSTVVGFFFAILRGIQSIASMIKLLGGQDHLKEVRH